MAGRQITQFLDTKFDILTDISLEEQNNCRKFGCPDEFDLNCSSEFKSSFARGHVMMDILVAPDRIALFAHPGIGEVVKAISSSQRGRVKFRASFWPAKFYSESPADKPALPLEQVMVVGIDGITLLVTPLSSAQTA